MRFWIPCVFWALGCSPKADDEATDSDTGVLDTTAPWPDWIHRPWVWEDESTQESALALVEGYIERDIPVGAIIIDSPWATGYSTYEWDRELFPDPQGMIDQLHEWDVRVFMWTVPGINVDETELYGYASERGWFMQEDADSGPKVIDWWKGEGSLIDYHNEEAVDWWHGLIDQTLDYGIDGWKCDGLDFSAMLAPYSPGAGRNIERIEYSHAYYRDFHDYTREVLGDDRVITARPVDNYGADIGGEGVSFAPKDITWAGWVGDQDPSFDGLEAALRNMYWSAEMGYTMFGSDIGGYRDDSAYEQGREKRLFIRWAQLGALNPIMENGGSGMHHPWAWDDETVDIYRRFAKLHDSLTPYLNEQGGIAFAHGESLMEFTHKPTYSYQLGPDLFVVPVLDEDGYVPLNFPDGTWVYAFQPSEVFESGGETMWFSVSLDSYPLFYREGSEVGATVAAALEEY